MRSKSLCVSVWVSVWFRVCYALYKYYFCLPFLFPEQNIFYILLDLFHNYLSLHLNSVCVFLSPPQHLTAKMSSPSSFRPPRRSCYCFWIVSLRVFFYSFNFIFDHRRLLVTFTPNRITTPWVALLTSTDRKHDGRARVWLCVILCVCGSEKESRHCYTILVCVFVWLLR